MKRIFFLLFPLITNLFFNDFDLEIMSASDGSNATIFKFSDNITYSIFLVSKIGKTHSVIGGP